MYHERQKAFYDRKVYGKPYTLGDLVWLYSPVPQKGTSRKLYHPWTGPFKVVKKISDVTYRIQQQQGKRLRKIEHFDRLKPYFCNIQSKLNSKQSPATTEDPTAHMEQSSTPLATIWNYWMRMMRMHVMLQHPCK